MLWQFLLHCAKLASEVTPYTVANNAKHPQITLLLTRPQRGSQAFWDALPAETRTALTPIHTPLISIEPIANDLPNITNVVFSSANGPLFGPKGHQNIAYCVGAQTKQAAQTAGWIAHQMGNSADELVEQLLQTNPAGPLTHLCGRHTRGDIAARLTTAGIQTTETAVYDQVIQPLSDHANTELRRENPVILPLFSPRTARQFARQYKGCAPLHIIALSSAVAAEVSSLPAENVMICVEPTRNAMLKAVQNVTASIALG
jgi:uroporphyrinogen-III synthase